MPADTLEDDTLVGEIGCSMMAIGIATVGGTISSASGHATIGCALTITLIIIIATIANVSVIIITITTISAVSMTTMSTTTI
jgi:hypothetical protein